jgi:hypothetical protein
MNRNIASDGTNPSRAAIFGSAPTNARYFSSGRPDSFSARQPPSSEMTLV